jgi:hypothetical protein
MFGARERCRDLDQQSRFADAGISAQQQHRAAHESAAGDAIEFRDAGGEPRRVVRFAGKWLERELPALARRLAGQSGAVGAFLADRIPLAAGVALALPAAVDGAAVLTDKRIVATGHRFLIRSWTRCWVGCAHKLNTSQQRRTALLH